MTTPHSSAPTRALPERPDITHLKREAKTLRKAFLAGEPEEWGVVHGHGEPERPLHFAAWYGHLETAQLLLNYGYSPAVPSRKFVDDRYIGSEFMHERTPFHIAAARGHLELVKLFVGEMQKMREPKP